MEPHELKEALLNRALKRAGIERSSWRPARGVDENRRTVEAVYTYYGRLFLDHPHLKWVGMANMIGPAFYAGFRDLGLVPEVWRRAVHAVFGRASRSHAKLPRATSASTRPRFSRCRRRSSRTRRPCTRRTSPTAS